jgi:hypothetical protein
VIAAFWLGLLGAVAVTVIVNRRRTMLPQTPIADAPDARVVRIRGKVVGELALRAPLTGRPCAYYFVGIHAAPYNRRNMRRFAAAMSFTISDETGRAEIPDCAEHEVPGDRHVQAKFRDLSPRIRAAIGNLGIAIADTTEVTLYEGIIGEGDEIDVTGAGMRRLAAGDASERGFRDRPTGVFVLSDEVHVLGERRPQRGLE